MVLLLWTVTLVSSVPSLAAPEVLQSCGDWKFTSGTWCEIWNLATCIMLIILSTYLIYTKIPESDHLTAMSDNHLQLFSSIQGTSEHKRKRKRARSWHRACCLPSLRRCFAGREASCQLHGGEYINAAAGARKAQILQAKDREEQRGRGRRCWSWLSKT